MGRQPDESPPSRNAVGRIWISYETQMAVDGPFRAYPALMWAPCDECGNDQPLQRTGAAGIPEPPEAINHARHQRSQPARVLGAEAQLDKMVDHLRRNQLQTHHKWEMSANSEQNWYKTPGENSRYNVPPAGCLPVRHVFSALNHRFTTSFGANTLGRCGGRLVLPGALATSRARNLSSVLSRISRQFTPLVGRHVALC